jgi:hypothetical protein
MGYLIQNGEKPYLLFTILNADLLLWDITNPIQLKGTTNFVINQCTIVYTNGAIPLDFVGGPEINLIDRNGVKIQYAFDGGAYSIPQDSAVRLAGGNKSSGNILPYDLQQDLYLENTTSVLSADGDLLIYLWGTFL